MIKVEKLLLKGVIDVNCYVAIKNSDVLIIDPGSEKKVIQKYVKDNRLNVVGILLTHAHIDHIIALDCFEVPIYCSQIENINELSRDDHNGRDLWDEYFGVKKTWDYKNLNIVELKDKQEFIINSFNIKAYLTNGHSFGDMSYVVDDEVVFSGDCLFTDAIGRWDYPVGCDLHKLVNSVIYSAQVFDKKLIMYPGHGISDSVENVLNNNVYVKTFTSWTEDQLNNWVKNNNVQLKDWNEYALVTFGMSLEQIKQTNRK